MKTKNCLISVVMFSVLFLAVSMSYASPGASILYAETNLGSSWQYDYTFNNTSTAGENLFKLFLEFGSPITVTGLPLPSGWSGTVWEGTNTNTYLSTMSLNSSDYISAAGSLGGFSFTVNDRLGNLGFYAEFQDSTDNLYNLTGTTAVYVPASPPVVPEPVSSVLFITGGAALALRKRFKRKK